MYTETTHGAYHGPLPDGLLDEVEAHLREYDLPMARAAGRLRVTYPGAEADLEVAPARLDVTIRAIDPVQLYHLRERALYLLDHVAPEAAAAIAWTGGAIARPLPPSFHPVTLRSITPVGASFLRVEVDCAGVAALDRGGMHFSLLLPPEGRAPVWPHLNDKGRTVWPEGADALHRAGYTFVALEAEAGRFSFDIYRHEGGRVSDWAHSAQPGDRVAVMGPGGGDFPEGDDLLIAGDETALPAIRRILALSAPHRRGRAVIEIGDPADRCDLPRPAGITLDWVLRAEGGLLPVLLALDPATLADHFVWVATEQEAVRRAKAHLRPKGAPGTRRGYFSAYWAREA